MAPVLDLVWCMQANVDIGQNKSTLMLWIMRWAWADNDGAKGI